MVRIAARPTAMMAYRVLLRDFGRFVWLGGGWMTCVLACVVVKMLPWPTGLFSLLVAATVLVVAVASAAASVSWYRAILLDETSWGVIPMEFGARQLRYFGYQSAIAVILGAPITLLCLVFSTDIWWAAAFSFLHRGPFHPLALLILVGSLLALSLAVLASFRIAARLMLALAAAAIDETGRLLRESWQHTRNDAPALFYGWIGCILPVGVLWTALAVVLTRTLGDLAGPVLELLAYLCYFIALGLTAGFFAYVFAQYAEGPIAEEAGEPAALPAQ